MADDRVFSAFNFSVDIKVDGIGDPICSGAFAECDGLEISMEPKTFHQGGFNVRQTHLAGPVSYAQLTLKRGMSKDFGLWQWFNAVTQTSQRSLRGEARITMLGADREQQVVFILSGCMPVKLRASVLNAREGVLAIEEMQLVYAALDVETPT